MKLVRFGAAGQEKPGIVDAQGAIRDLSAHVKDFTGETRRVIAEQVGGGAEADAGVEMRAVGALDEFEVADDHLVRRHLGLQRGDVALELGLIEVGARTVVGEDRAGSAREFYQHPLVEDGLGVEGLHLGEGLEDGHVGIGEIHAPRQKPYRRTGILRLMSA